MKLITINFALILLVLFSGSADAHENTPLSWKDGKILGLPKKHSPASFDLKKLSLTIKGRRLVFPRGLRGVLMYDASGDPFGKSPEMKPLPYTYEFTASWHHGDHPPCTWITIRPQHNQAVYELQIDMEKLEFIYADVIILGGRVPIDLDGVPDNPKKK